jgi:hypothetical protein
MALAMIAILTFWLPSTATPLMITDVLMHLMHQLVTTNTHYTQ